MPFEIRDDVYIKKSDQPLILEQYEQVLSISIGKKMRKPYKYLEVYNLYIEAFLKVHDQIRKRLLASEPIPQSLWDQYEESKANALTANEKINDDYEHEEVEADKT
jgi:hypothetical protein